MTSSSVIDTVHSTTIPTTSQVQHQVMIPSPADCFHPQHQRRTDRRCLRILVRPCRLYSAIHLGMVVFLQSILATGVINVSTLEQLTAFILTFCLSDLQSRRLRVHAKLCRLYGAIHLGIVVLLQSILVTGVITVSTLDITRSIHTNLLLIRAQSGFGDQ